MPRLVARGLLVATLAAGATIASAESDPFADCLALAGREGPSEEACECLYLRSRDQRDLAETARRHLEALGREFPSAPWPSYFLGRVPPWLDRGRPHLSRAARLFEADGNVSHAIRARHYLATWNLVWLEITGESKYADGAAQQLALLDGLLERSIVPQDRALVDMAHAYDARVRAADFQSAHLLLRNAYDVLSTGPEVHRHELKECLRSLLDATLALAKPGEARHWAEQYLQHAMAEGRLRDQASAAFDVVTMRLHTSLPTDSRRAAVLEDLYSTLELAQRAGQSWIEASARQRIAEIEGGEGALAHLDRCLELTATDAELRARCLKTLAAKIVEEDPASARALLDEANGLSGQRPWAYLASWRDQMRVVWQTEDEARALEDAQAILTVIEALRRNQIGEASDRLLSYSADAYYWLSGRLLGASSGERPAPASRAARRAFAIFERLRAQTLREALEAPETNAARPRELSSALAPIDREFAELTRRLFDADLGTDARQALLLRLAQLDREAAEIRRSADPTDPAVATLEPPSTDLLERIEQALGEDEAMLSFQIGLWEGWDGDFAGGSWLTVATSDGSLLYPLEADRAVLEPAVRALRARSTPEDETALAALHRRLLQPALSELPDRISKLVLVPDGMLHLLPFTLLREREGGEPLVERYELQTVPSASVWLHWREGTTAAIDSGAGALVLANPLVPMETAASRSRSGSLAAVASLGPLPYAEREGERVLRNLNGHGRLERRAGAREGLLKGADLEPFRVVHFAAHAYLDLEHPGLSGILLTGGDGEDGLLRPSEIARLEGLNDKLIVLAACNTAAGEVLRGEGVLSVARAFFQAGAESVVASLWKIDDREATDFFDDFYRRLREGVSVSEALTETQSAWSRAGRPASTWGALVVLGNGDFVPLPGGVPPDQGSRSLVALGGLLALGLLGYLLWLDSRRAAGAFSTR